MVRESNQDSGLAMPHLVVVADGMGGHRGGETASRIAVDVMRELGPPDTIDDLVAGVVAANAAVYGTARTDSRLDGMGTTLTAIAVVATGDRAVIGVVNVGDSRTYLFHDGELRALTDDHSMVAALLRDGQITETEALRHPHRNILTRALGVDPEVEVDAWEVEPAAGDRLVLCSDGLINEVGDDQIAGVLRRLADPDEAAAELVRLANEGGGRDNVTVAVVELVDIPRLAGAASGPVVQRPFVGVPVAQPVDDPGTEVGGRGFDLPPAPRERASRVTWRVGVFVLALVALVIVAIITLTSDSADDAPIPITTTSSVTTAPASTRYTSTTSAPTTAATAATDEAPPAINGPNPSSTTAKPETSTSL